MATMRLIIVATILAVSHAKVVPEQYLEDQANFSDDFLPESSLNLEEVEENFEDDSYFDQNIAQGNHQHLRWDEVPTGDDDGDLPTVYDYHNKIGIPAAAELKALEEAQDFDGNRISGGWQTPLGVHPHVAGLVITTAWGTTSVCTASLVSNTRLVTAAHCWNDGHTRARQMVVVLGVRTIFSGGVRHTTTRVEVHRDFWPQLNLYDLAIITIPWTGYNNNIRNVALASGTNTFAGVWATVAGYGRNNNVNNIPNNQVQHHTDVPVITNPVCAQYYGGLVRANVICTSGAGGRGPCGGDSGGPLHVRSGNILTLIGVVSFGSRQGCGSTQPSGYMRVTSFNAWIRARI